MSIVTGILTAALATGPSPLGPTYVPFFQPLTVLEPYHLWLLGPLVLAIAIVLKALHSEDLRQLPRQALSLAAQIVGFMVLAAAALWLITLLT